MYFQEADSEHHSPISAFESNATSHNNGVCYNLSPCLDLVWVWRLARCDEQVSFMDSREEGKFDALFKSCIE
jgi:hypothetical protein